MLNLVRCPSCQDLSEVDPASYGQVVACPFCKHNFRAERLVVPSPTIPTVYPVGPIPTVYPVQHRTPEEHSHPEPTGLLWACALGPVTIPIFWMIGLFALKANPIFSFALPMGMALSLGGINCGILFAENWSTRTKIKAVLMVGLLGLFFAASVFFMKKEWAEGFKNQLGPNNLNWQDYEPTDKAYRIKFPGRTQETTTPLGEWELKAVRTSIEGRRARSMLGVIYIAAHGKTLTELKDLPDEDCFNRVLTQLREQGEVGETRNLQIPFPGSDREHPGREWVIALPDGVTNRVVRVYRVRQRGEDLFFYLAVEGAFVTPEAKYVQDFLKAFALRPPPRR